MKTIVITGVSSGLGRAMAAEALGRGHRVVGTLRKDDQRAEFESLAADRSFGRILDVSDTEAIEPFVHEIEDEFGAIDVLVNNAGYGLTGVTEELELAALRHQFEVNVFGVIALTRAVLPAMRARRAGHVVNNVSMGGMITFPGFGAYQGSKFALLGMTNVLAEEVEPLGVKVTALLPGFYRSDWSGRSQEEATHKIADYDAILDSDMEIPWGDPAALGRVVMDAIELDDPPRNLLVGPSALRLVRERLDQWRDEIDRWESLSWADGEG